MSTRDRGKSKSGTRIVTYQPVRTTEAQYRAKIRASINAAARKLFARHPV